METGKPQTYTKLLYMRQTTNKDSTVSKILSNEGNYNFQMKHHFKI